MQNVKKYGPALLILVLLVGGCLAVGHYRQSTAAEERPSFWQQQDESQFIPEFYASNTRGSSGVVTVPGKEKYSGTFECTLPREDLDRLVGKSTSVTVVKVVDGQDVEENTLPWQKHAREYGVVVPFRMDIADPQTVDYVVCVTADEGTVYRYTAMSFNLEELDPLDFQMNVKLEAYDESGTLLYSLTRPETEL